MNQKITLSQGIKYGIIGLALLLFLLIWPVGIVEKADITRSREIQVGQSGPINSTTNGMQLFLAMGEELEAVKLRAVNDMSSQTIIFRIHNTEFQPLWETTHKVEFWRKWPGFIKIPVGIELQKGSLYFYSVEGITEDLYLAYEETAASESVANGGTLYGGQEVVGSNIITRYVYEGTFTPWMIVGIGVALSIAAAILCFLTEKLFSQKLQKFNRTITLQNVLQWICNPLLVLGMGRALWAVFPGRMFGTGIVNYAFYYLGIILAALVLFWAVNHKRRNEKTTTILKKEIVIEKLPQWAMAICFAKILWSCYEYLNGLYNLHHYLATCRILTWLGLAILCTLKKEEWLKIWNLLYLIPAAIIAFFYNKPYAGMAGEDALYGRLKVRLTFVAGFVAFQILVSFIQLIGKKRRANGKFNYFYVGLLGFAIAMMIVYRNTREWPIIIAVMFGVFYYRMWLWEKRRFLMQIFCNGIIFNFIYMVYYCLMHRPYLRFKYNRFGMGFHTVTMTGYYLALVLAAVMIKLFAKYYETKRWQECWKELSLLGIGNVYLFLTLSRTGYLAAIVMEIFMCIFLVILKEEKKLQGIWKKMAAGIFVSVLFFPIVFTAQRLIPAVVNEPIYSDIEVWEYIVEKGDPKDSGNYMDITAFCKLAGNKLFNLDMGNISLSLGKPVYVTNDTVMVASEAEIMEDSYDISSGRFEIFRTYIGEWNLTGHDEMYITLENGTVFGHAHNSFLQVVHDHGLIVGIVFVVFGAFSFFFSIWRYGIQKETQEEFYNALGIAILLVFALAGMVEWIFHFANPVGFSVFIVLVPLLFQRCNGEKNEK